MPSDQVTLGQLPPAKRKASLVMAGVGLGLVGLSAVPIGSLLAPHSQVVYQCMNGQTGQAEVPNLVERILQGPRLSPKAKAILACEGVTSPADLQSPTYRAALSWEALLTRMGGSPTHLKDSPTALSTATVWPYGQAMAAALDQAKVSGDYGDFEAMVQQLEQYRADGGGYHPGQGGGDRFFDDNAWLGLVFAQAHQQVSNPLKQAEYLHKAQSIFEFLQTGITSDGGILWKENADRPSYNTCALGPTIELALRLHEATGQNSYLQQARSLDSFMDAHLRLSSGLYADNIGLQLNDLDPALYSYNQGTPAGAKMLLYRATGEEHYLQDAQQTARAALDHYQQEGRLWQHSPAFNAILFRNLLQVPGVEARTVMDQYLERTWQETLDPNSGLFNREAGQGSYEHGKGLQMIDQAGLVQLYALQGWAPGDLAQVT